MKKEKNNNSGFTLIELIIAIAILSFLITSICTFMMSGVLSFKKNKADIEVHTSAQETYNQITDTLMQANDVYILAYTSTSDLTFDISYQENKVKLQGDLGLDLSYYVKGDAQEDKLKNLSWYDSSITIKRFSDLASDEKLYVKQLIVETAANIDAAYLPSAPPADFTNAFTGEDVNIKPDTHTGVDGVETTEDIKTQYNSVVYNVKDTRVSVFTFTDNKIYLEQQYAYMTNLDDKYDSTDSNDSMLNYIYCDGLAYVVDENDVSVPGCVMTLSIMEGNVSTDLFFSNKNMTYTTLGKVNFRNSYILREKQ